MKERDLEALYRRYREHGDLDALAEVFDRMAPLLARLARRLGAERSAADDLVQETFLTAMEHPETYDETRPLAPWLFGILAHRAGEERRRRRRALDPERLLRAADVAPERALAAAELREQVTAAVDALPPSLRAAVEGKLLAERSGAELADELRLTGGALRTRLSRGLERLRRALPPGLATGLALALLHSRGMAQVRRRVLNEAVERSTAKVAASAWVLGTEWIVMSKALVAAAAVVVVGVVGWSTWPWRGALPVAEGLERSALRGASDVAEVAPQGAPTSPARLALDEAATQARAGAALPRLRLAVVVHHERDDAPIEGLPVELVFERGGAAESLERTTDAAGRVRFHLDPGDAPSRVSVLATAITTPATKWLGGGPRSGEVEVRLVVSGGHRLEGRVVDENGAPVVGATVTGWCGSDLAGSTARTTRTDADGRFALEHLGPEFVVTARAADRECADGLRGTLTRDVVGAEAETLELRLGPAVEIAGVVVTPAGEVVAGAEVEARSGLDTSTSTDVTAVPGVTHFHPANSASARSDAHGRFTLTGLTGGVRAVFATSPPYLVTRAELSAGAAGNRLVLDAGLALRGRVVDASGRPAAGATVRFWPYWGNVQTTPSKVLTDAAGEFRLLGWSREGNHGIGVVYAGHAIQVVQPVFPGPDGGEPVLVELEPEGVIAGVVLDGERRPVPDASVRVEGTREVDVGARFTRRSTWEWRLGVDETRTDALGRFRFDRLYDGDFVVHVVPAGDAALGQDVRARTGEEALEVVLDARAMRKVAFVGRVVDARSRAPIERFTVTPMIAGSGRNHEFEDEQGRFELAGLPEGPIEVVVEAEGYARFATAVREYRAGTHELRPALEEARSLELRITDSRGESIPSGGVRVRAPGGNRVGIREAAGISDRLSFEAGVAHLHGLPARPLEVVLDVPGAAETQVDVDLTFARREPLHVVVDPEPQVEVTLLVLGGSDQGASGATFEAELRRRLALPQSEENERWLREALSEAWRTRLCSSVRVEFEVPDGSRGATVEVTPAAESDYEVVVLTRDSLGNAQSNRGVRPQPFGSLRLSARRWTLRVTADGYRPVERELDLSTALDGDRRTEPLVLLPR